MGGNPDHPADHGSAFKPRSLHFDRVHPSVFVICQCFTWNSAGKDHRDSVAQSAAEYVGRMRELGLRTFRVDLLRETPNQVGPLLDRYARVIAGRDDGRETWRQLRALNQLGVTRGTLQLVESSIKRCCG